MTISENLTPDQPILTDLTGDIDLLTDNKSVESAGGGLWADVPIEPQPDITGVSSLIERQINIARDKYQQMGVPRQYLTQDMIWKLLRGGKNKNVHFQ